MRTIALTLAVLLALSGLALAASPTDTSPPKPVPPPRTLSLGGRVGGEDIGTAVVIPELPFFDSGNTCGYEDDYDESCPWGSDSPDVVYSFTPPYDVCIGVSLCDSYYDTKVFIYEGYYSPGWPFACNDDNSYCYEPPVPYTSWIQWLMLTEGVPYYIVVDGYSGDCGDYEIVVVDCVTMCPVECPPEGVDEGEGPCFDGYVDQFNGGCNSNPVVYSELEPSEEPIAICGMSGNYDNNTLRDTDWYLLDLTCDETTVTATIEAEFPVMLGFIDLREGCENVSSFYSFVSAQSCTPTSLSETLPPGEWVVWVSTWDWPDFDCDMEWTDYVLTIEGYEACVPVERATWGTVKGMYR